MTESFTTFRGRMYEDVYRPADEGTDEALETARALAVTYKHKVLNATVDRRDGLLLVFSSSRPSGWHFQSPLCGYEGSGPQAAAQILEMFGFGNAEDILAEIKHGDNSACYTFER